MINERHLEGLVIGHVIGWYVTKWCRHILYTHYGSALCNTYLNIIRLTREARRPGLTKELKEEVRIVNPSKRPGISLKNKDFILKFVVNWVTNGNV